MDNFDEQNDITEETVGVISRLVLAKMMMGWSQSSAIVWTIKTLRVLAIAWDLVGSHENRFRHNLPTLLSRLSFGNVPLHRVGPTYPKNDVVTGFWTRQLLETIMQSRFAVDEDCKQAIEESCDEFFAVTNLSQPLKESKKNKRETKKMAKASRLLHLQMLQSIQNGVQNNHDFQKSQFDEEVELYERDHDEDSDVDNIFIDDYRFPVVCNPIVSKVSTYDVDNVDECFVIPSWAMSMCHGSKRVKDVNCTEKISSFEKEKISKKPTSPITKRKEPNRKEFISQRNCIQDFVKVTKPKFLELEESMTKKIRK